MLPPATVQILALHGANLSLNGADYPPATLQTVALTCKSKGTRLTIRNGSAVPTATLQILAQTLKESLLIED